MVGSSNSESGDNSSHRLKSELRALTPEEARDIDRARLSDKTKNVLDDADRRDGEASARDAVADERERVADRQAFTDPEARYAGHREMRDAALDRRAAKSDREYSAEDRAQLAEDISLGVPEGGTESPALDG